MMTKMPRQAKTAKQAKAYLPSTPQAKNPRLGPQDPPKVPHKDLGILPPPHKPKAPTTPNRVNQAKMR